jgi:RNA-splicing ligase RtcB
LRIALGKPGEDHADVEVHRVDPKVLDEYAGDYELAPGVVLTFVHRDGRLFTHGPGQPEVEIYPRSDSEFFLKVAEGSVQFTRDSTGAVSGILVKQGGRNMPAGRVK